MRVFIRFPLDTLQTPIVESKEPDAKNSPRGENTTLQTYKEWPVKDFINSPLYTFHNPIDLSLDPDAKNYPFGEKDTL